MPRAQRDQSGSLTEGVAHDRIGANAEAGHEVRGDRAESDLGENYGPDVADVRTGPPDLGGLELRTQALVRTVLGAKNLGPLEAKFASHSGILASRSGVDEGQLSFGSERVRREKHPAGAPVRWVVPSLELVCCGPAKCPEFAGISDDQSDGEPGVGTAGMGFPPLLGESVDRP